MTNHVKIKLCPRQLIPIQFRKQNRLISEVKAGKKFPKGVDNTATAPG